MKLIGTCNYTKTMDLKTWGFWLGIHELELIKRNLKNDRHLRSINAVNKLLKNYELYSTNKVYIGSKVI